MRHHELVVQSALSVVLAMACATDRPSEGSERALPPGPEFIVSVTGHGEWPGGATYEVSEPAPGDAPLPKFGFGGAVPDAGLSFDLLMDGQSPPAGSFEIDGEARPGTASTGTAILNDTRYDFRSGLVKMNTPTPGRVEGTFSVIAAIRELRDGNWTFVGDNIELSGTFAGKWSIACAAIISDGDGNSPGTSSGSSLPTRTDDPNGQTAFCSDRITKLLASGSAP